MQNLVQESIWPMLAQESLKALGGLGLLSLSGKYILRRVFEVLKKVGNTFHVFSLNKAIRVSLWCDEKYALS